MKNLRTKLAAATLAGMLMSGSVAAPAFAGGSHHDDTDGKIVVHIEQYKKNGAKKSIETKELSYEKAAKRAADKCSLKGHHAYKDLKAKAERVDEKNTKKVLVCTDEKGKKGKKEYVKVYFADNKEKGGRH